jgi:hypothetical protein
MAMTKGIVSNTLRLFPTMLLLTYNNQDPEADPAKRKGGEIVSAGDV